MDIQRLKCNIGKQTPSKQHVLLALGLCTGLTDLVKIRGAVTRKLAGWVFFFWNQDGRTPPARSSHLSPRRPTPWKKTGLAARPGRGTGQRHTAGGTAAWPAGLPRSPHLVAGPSRSPPRPGRRKPGPGRPMGAPGKSHSLIRKRAPAGARSSTRGRAGAAAAPPLKQTRAHSKPPALRVFKSKNGWVSVNPQKPARWPASPSNHASWDTRSRVPTKRFRPIFP